MDGNLRFKHCAQCLEDPTLFTWVKLLMYLCMYVCIRYLLPVDSGNDSDSNNYDSDEEQIKERKPRSYSLGRLMTYLQRIHSIYSTQILLQQEIVGFQD